LREGRLADVSSFTFSDAEGTSLVSQATRADASKAFTVAKKEMKQMHASLRQRWAQIDGDFEAWYKTVDDFDSALASGSSVSAGELKRVKDAVLRDPMAARYRNFKELVDGYYRQVSAQTGKITSRARKM
jgi:prophage tail gpP-like protein